MIPIRPRTAGEYLLILWRQKYIVFFVSVFFLILSCLIVSKIQSEFESQALVLVSDRYKDLQLKGTHISAVTEQLTSRATIEAVVRRYDLVPPGENLETTIERMRKNIKIETKTRSDQQGIPQSFSITFRHSNPKKTQLVLSDLVALFDQANKATRTLAEEELHLVDTEISQTESQLKQLVSERASARRVVASGSSQVSLSGNREKRTNLTMSLDSLSDKQFALEQQIAEQKRLIAEQEKVVKTLSPMGVKGSSSYGILLVRKAELEARQKELLGQYTEKNPKVTQAQMQLAEVNRQLAQLDVAGSADAGFHSAPESQELRSLQRDLVKMEIELEVTLRDINRKKQSLSTTPEVGVSRVMSVGVPQEDNRLQIAPEINQLQTRHTSLAQRQEALKWMLAAAPQDNMLFTIFDSPNLPKTPVGPSRLKYYAVGLVFSLAMGLIGGFLVEIPRFFRVYNARDIEYYLGVPVVVLIPEVVSQKKEITTRLIE